MRAILPLLLVTVLVAVSLTGAALPLPGLNGETTNMVPVVGRVFPEPYATNDYIGYKEAVAGLKFLNKTYPDRMEFIPIGKSVGWTNRMTNAKEPSDVFIVEVTNEKSALDRDHKIRLLFMLSIHGNEKGGREGGLRVIEDLAKGNVGIAAEKPDMVKLLDYFLLVFLFSNADGWTHDEPEYFTPGTMYTRENANGVDLNRQWPTSGFMQGDRSHQTLSEPEIKAATDYLKDHYGSFRYASDIHGMLNPADFRTQPPGATETPAWLQDKEKGHFILGMLPAGQMTQLEVARQTRLGELVRERLNAYPAFAPWTGVPSVGVWGGSFVRWGAVWETIGYQVSGGSHDWFVSDRGLNAPSFSFEMSYNHIVCDSEYIGCGAAMNHFHVNAVRMIVATFMEAATKDIQISIDVQGHKIGYLVNPRVITSAEDKPIDGWAAKTTNDDRWQYDQVPYKVSPNDFFTDLALYLRNGDKPAVFEGVPGSALNAEVLGHYDTFVIAGSAADQVRTNGAQLQALKAWTEAGGNLVVTDSALNLAGDLGLVDLSGIGTTYSYMGYTNVIDRSHKLAAEMLGFSRQTYEGVPLGYELGGKAPNWYIKNQAAQGKGAIVGVVDLPTPAGQAGAATQQANYGTLTLGKGQITYLGALLPDPSQEYYHPYGLVSYATTYAGNQFFINMIGAEIKYEAPPVVLEDLGTATDLSASPSPTDVAGGAKEADGTPGFAGLLVVGVLAAVAVALRRRA